MKTKFSLLLLIGVNLLLNSGCEKVVEKPVVEESELNFRNDKYYPVNSNTPYTGRIVSYHENGQLQVEAEFDDGPWAFVVPAIINNYYSRWWWPEDEKPGKNANDLLPWTGQYLDGFNNKITMHAYANPDSDSNGAGFGFIRFNTVANEVTFQYWPRNMDLTEDDVQQFQGWPVKIKL